MEKIDPELIKKWSQIEPSDAVFLPTKNEFIPDNFDLVPPPESPMDVPVIIKVGSMHVSHHQVPALLLDYVLALSTCTEVLKCVPNDFKFKFNLFDAL